MKSLQVGGFLFFVLMIAVSVTFDIYFSSCFSPSGGLPKMSLMKKKIFLICLFNGILLSINGFGQSKPKSIRVELYKQSKWLPFYPHSIEKLTIEPKARKYKLPAKTGSKLIVRYFDFDPFNTICLALKKGEISYDQFVKRTGEIVDTTKEFCREVKSTIGVLMFDNDTLRTVVIDANNNLDFTDDERFTYRKVDLHMVGKPDWNKFLITRKVQVENFLDLKLVKSSPMLTVYPFSTPNLTRDIKDSLDNVLYLLGASTDNIKWGSVNKKIRVYVKSNYPFDRFSKAATSIHIAIDESLRQRTYKVGDYFEVDGNKFKIDSLQKNGRYLILNEVENASLLRGTEVGFYIDERLLRRIKDSVIAEPNSAKFILFDFWGTWCAPCKELTPQIKSFNEKYKGKIEIVSVAVDNNDLAVKEYIEKNAMVWNNIIEPMNQIKGQNRVSDNLRIMSFPAFILINNAGKIIFRNSGINGYELLEKFVVGLVK